MAEKVGFRFPALLENFGKVCFRLFTCFKKLLFSVCFAGECFLIIPHVLSPPNYI